MGKRAGPSVVMRSVVAACSLHRVGNALTTTDGQLAVRLRRQA